MSLFNAAGSSDWDITDAGEKLCESFKKQKSTKKKVKKAIIKKLKVTATEATKKVAKNIRKRKNEIIKKISKNNYEDDKELLTNNNELLLVNKSPNKKKENKGVKRKRINNNMQEDEKLLINSKKAKLQKLENLVQQNGNLKIPSKKQLSSLPLRERMMRKVKSAKFRYLNEQMYTKTGNETLKDFKKDPDAFRNYHEGYRLQVKKWPMNPLDKLIKTIKKMDKSKIIADFGCGEAKLSGSVHQQVHSFDLVALNERVTKCDMAHVPLENSSVDIAVFCLSLMGTNLKDYLIEANRVLKIGGTLKIAEVESRFDDINLFIKNCQLYGFKKTWMDLSHNFFYFIDLKKVENSKTKKKLPQISLKPCIYKKR